MGNGQSVQVAASEGVTRGKILKPKGLLKLKIEELHTLPDDVGEVLRYNINIVDPPPCEENIRKIRFQINDNGDYGIIYYDQRVSVLQAICDVQTVFSKHNIKGQYYGEQYLTLPLEIDETGTAYIENEFS